MVRPVPAAGLLLAVLLLVSPAAGLLAPSAEAAGRPARAYDLNGDGFADLAVGVPGEDDRSVQNSGAVNVVYGSRDGLSARGAQLWSLNSRGVPGRARSEDRFGTVASGDFDGDGFADLAVGAPGRTVHGRVGAGSVTVLYGTRHGLRSRRSWTLSQSTRGVPGGADAHGGFGAALAAGDFNGDHRVDLAIGAPRDDIGPDNNDHGSVTVLLGGLKGLSTRGAELWDTGPLAPSSGLGSALTAGDVNGDGRADLVAMDGLGGVIVLRGAGRGLTARNLQSWNTRNTGLSAVMGRTGWFESMSLGDFNDDQHLDLALGTSSAHRESESDDCDEDAWCDGAVVVLPALPGGLFSTQGSQVLHWGVTGVSGGVTGLGRQLAGGDLDGDGVDELCAAAGDPDHGLSVVAISFARGAAIKAVRSTSWYAGPASVSGISGEDVTFGDSLQVAEFGRGPEGDLAIGVPGAAVGSAGDAGQVAVLYGSSSGARLAGRQLWSQDSAGVRGTAEQGDSFGVLPH